MPPNFVPFYAHNKISLGGITAMWSVHKFSFLFAAIITLSACSEKEQETIQADQAVEAPQAIAEVVQPSSIPDGVDVYAYTMLAPGAGDTPTIYARIVIDQLSADCPQLFGSDGSILQTESRLRNLGSGVVQVTDSSFPVSVCETVIAEGVSYNDGTGKVTLAAVNLAPTVVQVYGDSGCKEKNCGTQPAQAFQAVVNAGASQATDLILHMGDFNYRGTSGHMAETSTGEKIWAYDAGDGLPNPTPACGFDDIYYSQNALNSPKPDQWQNWKLDFFDATKPLLSKAPWVFARGNHELCSRAGVGWFYFFGPGSNVAGSAVSQMQCPDQGDFNNPPSSAVGRVQMIPPYMLKLGQFQTWVMDTANACDDYAGNPLTADYVSQYKKLATKTKSGLPTWVMSHRPVWGYQGDTISAMLQTALGQTKEKAFTSDVTLLLAGHMHIYESLTFFDNNGQASTRPPQLVIGNSGVSLNSPPSFLPCDGANQTCTVVDGLNVKGNALSEFGYLSMSLDQSGGWQGQLINEQQAVMANCDSKNPDNSLAICVLSSEEAQ